MSKVNHPFWVIVNKEISDHVKSWRFIILIGIIALTCMGSLYTALTNISEAINYRSTVVSFLVSCLRFQMGLSPLLCCLLTS